MASLRISAAPTFPQGTGVRAYPFLLWSGLPPQPGDTPHGEAEGGAAFVDSHGYAELTGLEAGAAFYIGAEVAGAWRWLTARTAAEAGGGGGGGGGASSAEVTAERAAREAADNSERSAREAADSLKAPLASPALTGTPTAPTPATADNSTKIATTAQVQAAVALSGGVTDSNAKAKILAGPYSPGVPLTTFKSVSVSGSYTPNLAEARVLKLALTSDTTLNLPTNFPVGSGARQILVVEATGAHVLTFGFVSEWINGEEPPQDTSKPRVWQLYCDDGTTWKGEGIEGLGESVVTLVSPVNGKGLVWNATAKVWEAAGPWLTKEEVDARVTALAIVTGGHPMALAGLPGTGQVPLTTSSSAASWTDLTTYIAERAPELLKTVTTISSGTTATLSDYVFYHVTKAGMTLTLPSVGGILPGALAAIENASGGALTLKGRLNPAEPENEVAEVPLNGAEVGLYVMGSDFVWRGIGTFRTLAALEALITGLVSAQAGNGTWTALESLGAKLEQATGITANAHGARKTNGGARAELRGVLQVKAGEVLKAGQKAAKVPAERHPAAEVWLTVATTLGPQRIVIATTGEITYEGAELKAGERVGLDDVAYSLT